MVDIAAMRFGSKEHEEFAGLVKQVLGELDKNFAAKFNHDPSGAQTMESTDPRVHGLRIEIEEFQRLCNEANSRIEPMQEEYRNRVKALAERFRLLNIDGYLELNPSGKAILQEIIGG
jgi:hypothetical protein